ncbi:MAG TPA: RNA polymerase sigma factor region1.1 domain-containing protein [Candidatus Bathyarchaeia archaeon]|nr:RNA polymerase sigma factor region1.1 domain-containing protein [Candidatus Bathyarchaeia archaeon]
MQISPNKNSARKEDVKNKALQITQEKGKITYDDLLEMIPEEATSEEMDDLMVELSGLDIEIVDEFRVDSETQQAQLQKEAIE